MNDILSKNNKAPIALFAYNRPDHLAKSVRSLASNPEASITDLTVFCDAAKHSKDQIGVDTVRSIARSIVGFASVTVIERDHNLGLAVSIIEGVTHIVNKFGRVIVIEDDLLLSQHFLRYMNDALDLYADNDNVISIHGYVYPVQQTLPESFFLRGADCWGWGTWRRGWALFNPDGQYLLRKLQERQLINDFDFNGAYSFSKMLKHQINGKNDSWAIRWHASAFLADKLTLHPGRSLVQNIGNDNSGTHCGNSNICDVNLSLTPIKLDVIEVTPSLVAHRAFEEFYKISRLGILLRVKWQIRRIATYFEQSLIFKRK